MVRDVRGVPLILLQLQKDEWSKVQKISKPDLVKLIGGFNKVKDESSDMLSHISESRTDKTGFVVESQGRAFQTVQDLALILMARIKLNWPPVRLISTTAKLLLTMQQKACIGCRKLKSQSLYDRR